MKINCHRVQKRLRRRDDDDGDPVSCLPAPPLSPHLLFPSLLLTNGQQLEGPSFHAHRCRRRLFAATFVVDTNSSSVSSGSNKGRGSLLGGRWNPVGGQKTKT